MKAKEATPANPRNGLNALKDLSNQVEASAQRRRDAAALARPQEGDGQQVYVGIAGADADAWQGRVVGVPIIVEPIAEPPGIFEVLNAANHSNLDYLAVSRLAPSLRFQVYLEVTEPANTDEDLPLNTRLDAVWSFLTLAKLASRSAAWSPAWSDRSWPLLCLSKDQSATIRLLDESPKYRFSFLNERIRDSDFHWAAKHYESLLALRREGRSRRFTMALAEFHGWSQARDIRQVLASIWIGLEALFGTRDDFRRVAGDRRSATRKLADRIASWLPTYTSENVSGLYDLRSAAIHGRRLSDHDIGNATVASFNLLVDSLVRSIELEDVPLAD